MILRNSHDTTGVMSHSCMEAHILQFLFNFHTHFISAFTHECALWLTLMTLSIPEVRSQPRVASYCIWMMLCLLSWNVAVGARLYNTENVMSDLFMHLADLHCTPSTSVHVFLEEQKIHLDLVTYSSSVIESWQLSQTRTSNSNPMRGIVERLEEHFPHTAWPHFLQWCWEK